jgi:hypothetical protein
VPSDAPLQAQSSPHRCPSVKHSYDAPYRYRHHYATFPAGSLPVYRARVSTVHYALYSALVGSSVGSRASSGGYCDNADQGLLLGTMPMYTPLCPMLYQALIRNSPNYSLQSGLSAHSDAPYRATDGYIQACRCTVVGGRCATRGTPYRAHLDRAFT